MTEPETVRCTSCARPTTSTGTKLCDRCWEISRREGLISEAVVLGLHLRSTLTETKQEAPVSTPDLASTLDAIRRTHGEGAIQLLEDAPTPVRVTSTGHPEIDQILGCGGYPRGRIIEIFGPDPHTLTCLGLAAIAAAQVAGERCALVDAAQRFDRSLAALAGGGQGRPNDLLISQPDNGEQGLDIVEILSRSGCVGLVVVDGVSSLVPSDVLHGTDASEVGTQARMMSKTIRKLCTVASKTETTVIFLNPTFVKPSASFGPSETTHGGNALKYYASVRIDARPRGAQVAVKVVKNKLAPPFRATLIQVPVLDEHGAHTRPMPLPPTTTPEDSDGQD